MVNGLDELKKRCLVLDIETSSFHDDGSPVDIMTDFDTYVKKAKLKWFGAYSYLYDHYYLLNALDANNQELIIQLLQEHDILIGHNLDDFDFPILENNNMVPSEERGMGFDGFPNIEEKRFITVDTMVVLGQSTYQTHKGFAYKNRGALMGYKFKNNSLKHMAEVMGLQAQKGDIDYQVFFKDAWTAEEKEKIRHYLQLDVQATKEMFDKLWDYWLPFTEFISRQNVENLSWIRSSIASLTYKAACNTLKVEETYADKEDEKEEMGGRVIEPKRQEARRVWYVDFASLYPHIMSMFNLFAEVHEGAPGAWHGNDVFQVKGWYDIREWHPLARDVAEKLKMRIDLKRNDPTNPKIYALKIFLNSLYGAVRGSIFEKIHTENAGWDTCWLGQQIQMLTEKMMDEFGFETIAGDTDSIFVVAKPGTDDSEQYVRFCLAQVVKKIKKNAPFPVDTYDIDVEYGKPLDYVMWSFSLQPIQDAEGNNIKKGNRLVKVLKGKKKNYAYIVRDKNDVPQLKIVGLPIIKDNATVLGKRILDDILTPLIIKRMRAKFTKEDMDHILTEVLKKPGALKLLAREFKVKPARSYKNPNQLQAQISEGYFGGQAGVIELVKNIKVGRAGKTSKYASVEEIIAAGVGLDDIDLKKLKNELEPFVIIHENNTGDTKG